MLTAPQVVLLFSALTIGSMGLLMVFLSHSQGNHVRGMSEWGTGLALTSATIIIAFFARNMVGVQLSVAIAQTLIVIALMIVNYGLRRFFEEPNPYSRGLLVLFVGAFIASAILFTWIYPSFEGRSIVYMLGGSIVLADMLAVLYRHRQHGSGVKILGVSIIGFLAVRTVKLVAALMGVPTSESLFDATAPQLIMLVLPSVLVPLATLAFILMGSERLVYRLNQMIRHDDLTGALNKASLYTELRREIARSVRYGHPLSLMMIDLDNFKTINDRHGHLQGDEVLKSVAEEIRSCVRSTDFVARFGGDEFAVLLTDTDIDATKATAYRVLAGIQGTLPADCGASVGISALRSHGETPESLLHRADQALYKAKVTGKNQISLA